MSLQDMNDQRLVQELVSCALFRSQPHMWGLSDAQARAELAEAKAEVLRRLRQRTNSAVEPAGNDVTAHVTETTPE